jgi:hypothetical protein
MHFFPVRAAAVRRTLRAAGLPVVIRRAMAVLQSCRGAYGDAGRTAHDLRALLEPLQALCIRLVADSTILHRVRAPCSCPSRHGILLTLHSHRSSRSCWVFVMSCAGHCEAAVRVDAGICPHLQRGLLPAPGGARRGGRGGRRYRLPGRRGGHRHGRWARYDESPTLTWCFLSRGRTHVLMRSLN